MKYIIHVVLAILIISCSNNIQEKQIFGDQNITEEGKISGLELLNTLASNDSAQVKVEAKINSICQKKGCWMYVDLGDTTEMLVRFKDYEFFVPMDATDKIAMIEKAVHEKNYTEKELYDLYKRFQFNINQLLNIKESSKLLTNIQLHQKIIQSDEFISGEYGINYMSKFD